MTKWQEQTRQARSRAFEPLPENAVCGVGGRPRWLRSEDVVQVPAREWRLRRAVELLLEAGDVGVAQAMLADVVRNPVDSPLWDDLGAIGATSARADLQAASIPPGGT